MRHIRLAALVFALWATQAQAEIHQRGDYRFETAPEPAFVQRLTVPSTWSPKAPGADEPRWRYWLYDVQVDRRNGAERVYVDYVYEARTPSLIGEAGKFEIGFNPAFETLALHRVEVRRDGAWHSRLDPKRVSLARREDEFEKDIANGAVSALIVLDDVRVGDVVRISYTVDGANPVLAGQATDWMRLAFGSPALETRYRVLYDAGTPLKTHRENTDVEPEIRQGGDGVEVVVRGRGAATVVGHAGYPRWYQPYPTVQVAREQSWRHVVDWALPLYPAVEGALPSELERHLGRWRGLPDRNAQLTAALRLVQDEVRYFGIEMGEASHRPHAPHEVWERRFGDCKDKAYLLTTLLGRLGIEAVPALVSVGQGEAVRRRLPSASAFDHVIVRARIDGRTVWVDPTLSQQGGLPQQADLSHLGAALPVATGVAALETVDRPESAVNATEVVERFVPDASGNGAAFTVETTYRGDAADRARRTTGGERREELSRRYAEFYGKRYGELSVVDLPRIEDDRSANVLRVREHYRLAKPFDSGSGGLRSLDVQGHSLHGVSEPPDATAHPGPLDVGTPGRFRHTVEVELPPQWSARFGTENVEHASSAFAYSRKVAVEDGVARVAYDFQIREPHVGTEGVAKHIGALRDAHDTLSATLRFQMPAALETTDRERRLKALLRAATGEGVAE